MTGGTQVTDANGIATVGSWRAREGTNNLIAYLQSNPLVFVIFTATGSNTLSVINSCSPGASGDPVSYPFYVPGSSKAMKQVELFLSSNGTPNLPQTYQLQLTARIGGFHNPAVATSTTPYPLGTLRRKRVAIRILGF